MHRKINLFLGTLCFWAISLPVQAESGVLRLRIEGIINPVITEYVNEGIKVAETKKSAAVLIELDTPGGLLDATRGIISSIINTDIPVIVYVAPRGARATSAGVFLMMASDVAAMASETHIGAAHPVTIGGETPRYENKKSSSTGPANAMEEKMVSDSAAYIRALAAERGRNADWAERAVRESVSLTVKEARSQKVIEYTADSAEELLAQLDGKTISKNKKTITLKLKGSLIEDYLLSGTRKFLHIIAHPNIAYILMTIGVYGLIYELATPGIGLGGAIGVICLLLAFFSLQVLPINTVGIVLIILGISLIGAEIFTPTHGVLAVGGAIAFAIGSFMMIDTGPEFSVPRVSLSLILPSVFVMTGFFFFVVRSISAARRLRPTTGMEGLVGQIAEVKEPFTPDGFVYVNGELWKARSEDSVQAGEKVYVTRVEGNFLVVKKYKEA